jgi:hypothetical protein
MGLLWTFMGSSPAYTAFAGAMETLGALLLVWRRTALLGALVSACVMLNVMLLNFCYDVPVKLFSFHLVVVGLCIALPEASRLLQLFLGLGPGTPARLAYPFTGRAGRWTHRVSKAYLLVVVLGLPLFEFVRGERASAPVWPALGEWKLVALALEGEEVAIGTGEVEVLTLAPRARRGEEGWTTDYVATLVGGASARDRATLTADRLTLASAGSSGTSRLVPGQFAWRVEGGELHLETPTLSATFVPAAHDFLLMRRGFRWINERPFNR